MSRSVQANTDAIKSLESSSAIFRKDFTEKLEKVCNQFQTDRAAQTDPDSTTRRGFEQLVTDSLALHEQHIAELKTELSLAHRGNSVLATILHNLTQNDPNEALEAVQASLISLPTDVAKVVLEIAPPGAFSRGGGGDPEGDDGDDDEGDDDDDNNDDGHNEIGGHKDDEDKDGDDNSNWNQAKGDAPENDPEGENAQGENIEGEKDKGRQSESGKAGGGEDDKSPETEEEQDIPSPPKSPPPKIPSPPPSSPPKFQTPPVDQIISDEAYARHLQELFDRDLDEERERLENLENVETQAPPVIEEAGTSGTLDDREIGPMTKRYKIYEQIMKPSKTSVPPRESEMQLDIPPSRNALDFPIFKLPFKSNTPEAIKEQITKERTQEFVAKFGNPSSWSLVKISGIISVSKKTFKGQPYYVYDVKRGPHAVKLTDADLPHLNPCDVLSLCRILERMSEKGKQVSREAYVRIREFLRHLVTDFAFQDSEFGR